jgi:hypothetical protein
MTEDFLPNLDSFVHDWNNKPNPDIDGLSPNQMSKLFYRTFETDSLLTLPALPESDYEQIPLLNQVRFFLELVARDKEIRLTKTGNIPVKMVKEIYDQRFILDELIEMGITKLYQEISCPVIHLTHILCGQMAVTKKRNGKLNLTKLGEKCLKSPSELLPLLLKSFCTKFNWAYFDGHGQNEIGQFGIGYSLYLISKYGEETRKSGFYAEKYFMAFPTLIHAIDDQGAIRCYSLRTFERFLDYFGVVKLESTKTFPRSDLSITKTELFDKVFVFKV